MQRRSLIKAIAAGSLTAATPLACLLARNALAAGNTAPIRTIFLFHPNGCVPDIFFPKAGSRTLPAMTAPLQSVYDNLVFIDGIGYAGPDYTHEGGAFKCLTGRMTRDDKFSSIDVLMGKEDWANRASNGISVPSVQMGVATFWGNDDTKRISHDNGTTLDSVCDPRIMYPRLFGGGANATGVEAQMLSIAKNDLNRLRSTLGSLEKARMDQHTEALSVLEARFRASSNTALNSCTKPDISPAPQASGLDTDEALSQTDVLDLASGLQQDIAVAALACGITRTIAFSYGVSVCPVKVPGSQLGDHDASHSDANTHTKSKIWWMGQVAKFIQKLANTPEGTGSLLDNTILVAVSDLAHGNYHNHYRIPMFLASGKNNNVGLVTGRSLDWRSARAATAKVQGDQNATDRSINHTDVLDTVRQVAGYTSFQMPNKEGDVLLGWKGNKEPR
ncbi:MAG TPA: DUF1552 domain-containing protein [Cellvibrionaceae bacterium]|nr:DUF1552 domain-containing protein [Cellvibrionaceae bacterium]